MRDEDTVRLFAAAEERLLNAHKQKMPVPVLLLSGSLGAGKTTLLNHLLSNKLNLRITAIVNDLSALNIDADMLITGRTERTFKLSNGCACHSLSGELEEGLWQTLQETDGTDRVDYVVIEMSGAASDPSRVVESLARRYGKMTRARLDGVVLVVDADVLSPKVPACGESAEEDHGTLQSVAGPILWQQLQHADRIVLNKIDLLYEEAVQRVTAFLQRVAPWAEVLSCSHGKVALPKLLDVEFNRTTTDGAPGHEGRMAPTGCFVTGSGAAASGSSSESSRPPKPTASSSWATDDAAASHGYRTIEFESAKPFQLAKFQDFVAAALCSFMAKEGEEEPRGLRSEFVGLLSRVHRMKGVIWFEECRRERWILQLAGRGRITLEHDGPWQSRPGTQLVIISRQGDDFQERLRSALLAVVGHEDDDSAASAPATDVLCEPCDGTNEDDYDAVEEAERVRVRLRDDPRFDLIIAADGECANSSSSDSLLGKRTRDGADEHPPPGVPVPVVHFQLVGAALCGIQREVLERVHRLDVNELTRSFLQHLNSRIDTSESGRPKPCLTGALTRGTVAGAASDAVVPPPEQQPLLFTARFAVGGRCRLEQIWEALVASADVVLAEVFARLDLCRCDHAAVDR